MKLKNLFLMLLAVAAGAFVSCDKEEDTPKTYSAQLSFKAPSSIGDNSFTWKEGTLVMTEINTGKKTSFSVSEAMTLSGLEAGQYNAVIDGEITCAENDLSVRGSKENITVDTDVSFSIDLIVYNSQSTFVFSEIYCAGSLKADGSSGITGDKFFKIYNNSDTVQFADGIAILESVLGCVDKYTYTPDPRDEGFASQVVYVIPGDGTEHPVQPGEYIVITDQASNHNADNPNAIDMSGADFEWFDDTEKSIDTDNPNVPNMDKWYSYSATIWTPNNQGNRAYAIARIECGKDAFLQDYYHEDWSYENSGITMYKKGYFVPNEWILDAVNLSPSSVFNMLGTSVSIDKGYVSISEQGSSKDRFGKSAQRKVSGETISKDGRKYTVLLDTNDSASDFTVETVSYKK